ncbi:MAG: 5-oxoprolinase subunit PxpA [Marinospirillum sp.]|uniref:5-oxoprolinase subunit PxpA n=1 Tax=Marinospirillum sp. TaxID=2183934 RepID=UPI0019F2BBED|nr:5-oxoprolinase subunit PxpA [Marinospirillum sp.]MBE0505193.1 5-oxoprolinase subunit PxpA [Marinospirillum sp.]
MLINADVGESFGAWPMGQDELLMPWLDQASIACGFHAGDPDVMAATVKLALEQGVEMGAHPSYPDLQGFGRRSMQLPPDEVQHLLLYQVGALQAIAQAEGGSIRYVKPHGALYNDMLRDPHLLDAVMQAVARLNQHQQHPLKLMLLARADNSAVIHKATEYELPLYFEAFADRAYTPEGLLMPRNQAGAVLHDLPAIQAQAQQLLRGQPVKADSLCVHGDHPRAVEIAETLFRLVKHHAI